MSDYPTLSADAPLSPDFRTAANRASPNNQAATSPASEVPAANGSTTANDIKSTLANARDTVAASMCFRAQQAATAISNHPITQNVQETINNGLVWLQASRVESRRLTGPPVTEAAKDQAAKTSAEFDNLKNARKVPNATTANNQPLTHYHSFFYTLLSWENPRATGIAFATSIAMIFAFRYVPALRLIFKSLYLVLGTVAVVEGITKLVFGAGIAGSMRPKRYITISRDDLESTMEDFEHLINFFVIEFQRILFAENVLHTTLAFLVSFMAYYLIKVVPTWGLLLIGTTVVFTVPLIYVTNREAIDHYLASANEVVNAQAQQIREIASQQTSQATETIKAYAGDYTAKAQELVGNKRSPSPEATFKSQDYPAVPKAAPVSNTTTASRPIPA